MALDNSDPKPTGISLRDAYAKIRAWYQSNAPGHPKSYAQDALPLIEALPPVDQVTDLEIRTVLSEVLTSQLEWAHKESDGQYKVGDYAREALTAAGLGNHLSEDEKQAIRASNSKLLPLFSGHILE